jgi:hypothetical protein
VGVGAVSDAVEMCIQAVTTDIKTLIEQKKISLVSSNIPSFTKHFT